MTDIAGTSPVDEISIYQDRILKVMMNGTTMNRIYRDQHEAGVYQFKDYLSDLFHSVWRPLADLNDMQVHTRRLLEHNHVDQLNSLLDPVQKGRPAVADRAGDSDIMLYLMQHLGAVEQFRKMQTVQDEGINLLRYNDLLCQIKLIHERRVTIE